ncbi:pentatricopeptide repeat-containing protein At5g16860 [Amborella trichopoda]|uniref:pentatricopeptide repeat-containing protein At5g16860 n=1 Tax=Amborella trichopoda TaxID=13333 RepID=UPI0005D3B348|nr:pentatricopeptide repeat-containing protein At5g16860 [Amborella trichopoda]|eukprot:XP_011620442.1 pentatricopeptide repeat-containing protein At5g16860 [Amborella trichopoda]
MVRLRGLRASYPAHFSRHLRKLSSSSSSSSSSCRPTVFACNLLIKHRVDSGLYTEALSLYQHMRSSLSLNPDNFTFPFLFKSCGSLSLISLGRVLHALAATLGFVSNIFVSNSLIAFYARCSEISVAHQVFDEMLERDAISWNSLIAAYSQNYHPAGALDVFAHMMMHENPKPDRVTIVNVLPACGTLRAGRSGCEIHAYTMRHGLSEDVLVGNALIDMYAKCELMGEALSVFQNMGVKDIVSWNSIVTGLSQNGRCEEAMKLMAKMEALKIGLNVITWSAVISGYAQRGRGTEALRVFREMQVARAEPNHVTLISLLSACSSAGALLHGREIHAYITKFGWCDNLMVKNALIDTYAKCRDYEHALRLFDSVAFTERNVVTWTVMIGGYAQNGHANEALQFFSQMLTAKASPNAFTISCALIACAHLSALRIGKQIHAFVFRHRFYLVLFISNCLIDMYSKCGDVNDSRKVFDYMPHKNSISWTTMMTGYGLHGRGVEALATFESMRRAGLPPDDITFLVVLYACSHAGLVDHGWLYFNSMTKDSGVRPGVEHYACMVDLLARAGRLNEAQVLIGSMPMEPSAVVWVALLSACRTHAHVELAELASQKLMELDSENAGTYTLLSNIYANAGRWGDVARVRALMRKAGIRKRPGCSWVQGKSGTATFYVGDRSNPDSDKIYEVLRSLIEKIKGMGYVPETSFALHDVDEEEKGWLLSEHSEKLAVAYGVLNTPAGMPIRIAKNLRVCGDCHTAIKYMSAVLEHEIIVRDTSRFHHFKEGDCSCRGFW